MSFTRIGIGMTALLVLIQLWPVDRSNPPVQTEIPASAEVRSVLERACYDCHSNQVRWPWYAYVAPVSWLVADDVHHAREHVNFSTWNTYDDEERDEALEELWEEVEEGEMPLPIYLTLHPEAELSEGEKQLLHTWSRELRGTLSLTEVREDGEDED